MPPLNTALLQALDSVGEEIGGLVDRMEQRLDAADAPETDPKARDQFLRAFLALLREGIEGGSEQRELVMTTAVPALVQAGQTPEDLVRSHVAFFMALSPLMLAHVPPELRDDASLWLADYAAGYTCEVMSIAQEATS